MAALPLASLPGDNDVLWRCLSMIVCRSKSACGVWRLRRCSFAVDATPPDAWPGATTSWWRGASSWFIGFIWGGRAVFLACCFSIRETAANNFLSSRVILSGASTTLILVLAAMSPRYRRARAVQSPVGDSFLSWNQRLTARFFASARKRGAASGAFSGPRPAHTAICTNAR